MAVKIGFIGLGAMGYPIAGKLAKYFPLYVWDKMHSKALEHANEHSTTAVCDLSEFGQQDYIMTSLPTSRESNNLFRQINQATKSKMTFIDLSSGDYRSSLEIAKELQPNKYIDAPVSGGPAGALAGKLTCMAGCSELSKTENTILQTFCSNIVKCGQVGHGNAIKSTNNFLNVTHLLLGADVLLRLKSCGISPEIALDAINKSSGRSLQTEVRIPQEVITRQFNYGFKLNLMRKDVLQANQMLEGSEFYKITESILEPHGDNEKDYTSIVEDLEKIIGCKLP